MPFLHLEEEGHQGVPECPLQVTPRSPGAIRPQSRSHRSCHLVSGRNVPHGGVCSGGNLQSDPPVCFFCSKGAQCSAGNLRRQHCLWLLPQPRQESPSCAPQVSAPQAGTAQTLALLCCSLGTAAAETSQPQILHFTQSRNWDQQKLKNNWAVTQSTQTLGG